MAYRLGIISTHPIQYYSPWYRALTAQGDLDVMVYYAHQLKPQEQAEAGFGVPFEWDVPLFDGYRYHFLKNVARHPNVSNFWGCDTPEIVEHIVPGRFDAFLVHGWYNRSFWQAMRACWRTRTPLMVRGDSQLLTPRSWLVRRLKPVIHPRFIPRFDAYLVVGQRAREYYRAYGAQPERMFDAPHCVDNEFFARAAAAARPRRAAIRQRWGLDSNAFVCLFAGKFVAKKRPLDYVRALALVQQRAPGLEGLMVGDGPLHEDIERQIDRDSARIRLCGFLNQSAIAEAYAAADVLILPSDGTETWGLVVNEAMATGLPAIVSHHVGCAPDLVREGKTGMVYTCGDVERLADILQHAVQDQDRWKQLGLAAREHVANYSIEAAVQGTCEAVRWLHAQRS